MLMTAHTRARTPAHKSPVKRWTGTSCATCGATSNGHLRPSQAAQPELTHFLRGLALTKPRLGLRPGIQEDGAGIDGAGGSAVEGSM